MPKVMLHKKNINLSNGNHIILNKDEKKHKNILRVNHFKWFGLVVDKMDTIIKDDITNGHNGRNFI